LDGFKEAKFKTGHKLFQTVIIDSEINSLLKSSRCYQHCGLPLEIID